MILFVSYYEKSWNIGCFIDMYLLDNCTQIHYFENNHVYNLIIFKFKSVKILVIHYPLLHVTPQHLSYDTEPYLNITSFKFKSHQKHHQKRHTFITNKSIKYNTCLILLTYYPLQQTTPQNLFL